MALPAKPTRPTSGLRSKTYVGAPGLDVATLVVEGKLLKIAREDSFELTAGEIDATGRGSTWRKYIQGLKEGSVPLTMLYHPDRPGFKLLREAYDSGDAVSYGMFDEYGYGFIMDGIVTAFSMNRPLEDVVTCSVTLRPTDYPTTADPDGREPTWVEPSSQGGSS